MPTVHPNGMGIYYEVPGEGDPLVLIPYLSRILRPARRAAHSRQRSTPGISAASPRACAGLACPASRMAPPSPGLLAGDVAALMQAAGVDRGLAGRQAGWGQGCEVAAAVAAAGRRRGPRSCRGLSAAQRRVCGWKRSHLETGAGGLALTVKAWGALLMLCGPGQARDSSNGRPGQSCRVVQSSGRA